MDTISADIATYSSLTADGAVPRPRVFCQLDTCRKLPVTWVCGPAGSGKSSLVAGYVRERGIPALWYRATGAEADASRFFQALGEAVTRQLPPSPAPPPLPPVAPEVPEAPELLARRFFQALCDLPQAPRTIVLDDLHCLPGDAGLHAVLARALCHLPAGLGLVLVSRELPHPAYARLRANNLLALLPPDSLRLTPEEAEAMLDALLPERPDGLGAVLHQRTSGWVAGIKLLAEQHRFTGAEAPPEPVPRELADYFASELFEPAAPELREFLLRTCAFQEMNAEMARRLSGQEGAAELLAELNRRQFFIELCHKGGTVYRYHPLFLEFLRARARALLGEQEVLALRRRAARLAQGAGFLEQAAELYLAAGEWQGLSALLGRLALTLVARGQSALLIEWLGQVPPAELDRHPRLHYWLGGALLSLAHCAQARERFERALELADRAGDGEGVYLAWAAIVDSYFLEMQNWHPLDRWVESFAQLQRRYPEPPSAATWFRVALSGFTARVLRQAGREQTARWRRQVDALLPQTGLNERVQAGLIKSVQLLWSGDYHQNRLILEQLREKVRRTEAPPPLPVLTLILLEAYHLWCTLEPRRCRDKVREGLELARQSGITVWNRHYLSCLAQAALIEEDYGEARALVREMGCELTSANNLDRLTYHLLSAQLDLLQGDSASALSHLEVGRHPAMAIGAPFYEGVWHLAMAQVKLKRKSCEEAAAFMDRALSLARACASRNLEFLALLYRAQLLWETGPPEPALATLREGMAIGRDCNYLHFNWWLPAPLAELCAICLRHGIETDYVRNLIRHRNLFPAVPPVDIPLWPWEVTITCLGRFEVQVGGVPVKLQKKPLGLLKSIIALGGREVRYERVADLLWPDADGDTGLGNLKITLHRLRQLLGENSVQFKDGKLSLDSRRLWIDLWAFERCAHKASTQWCNPAGAAAALELSAAAIELYQGQFLREDQDLGELYPLREKLSRSYVALVAQLGDYHRARGDLDAAIEVLQRGVELEPLAERLYEGLIRSYAEAGYRVDAIQAYRRYELALGKALDARPARRLTQLMAQL